MPERREPEYLGDWTVRTLHEHLQKMLDASDRLTAEQFDSLKEAIRTALANADKALSKAEHALELKLASQNEFRQTLSDQAATFMPRTEVEQRLKVLEQWQAERSGIFQQSGESKKDLWMALGILVTFVTAVAAFFVPR